MVEVGYYNGKIGPLEEMQIPMLDRACYFGDGVYDFAMYHEGKVFAFDEHLDRFYKSASMIEIDIPYTKEEMKNIILETAKASECEDLGLYWQISRGTAIRNHAFPAKEVKPNVMVMVKPLKSVAADTKFKLITVDDTRFLHCNIKTINLLLNVLANEKAKKAGCDEAVFHRDGRVTECSHCNIHILKNGVLRTAPADNFILPGVARAHIINMCNQLGIPVDETPFSIEELMDADEVIISSTSTLCIQASEVDGKPVGGKDIETFNRLKNAIRKEYNDFMGI